MRCIAASLLMCVLLVRPASAQQAVSQPGPAYTPVPDMEMMWPGLGDETPAPPPVAKEASPSAGKPTPAPAPDSHFSDMLKYVYEHHPALLAKREAVKAVDESVAQALSGFRPEASAGYSVGRVRNSRNNADWGYDNAQTRSLDVTQPVFSGGETVAGYRAAKDRVKAARAELASVEQQVFYDAIAAYTNLVESQQVLELNRHNAEVLGKQLEATKAKLEVGQATRTDLAQSESRHAAAQADLRRAMGDMETARADFRRAAGYDAAGALDAPLPPSGLIPANMEEAVAAAEAASPVLEAAKHNENAAAKDVAARTASLLPEVNLSAQASRSHGGSAISGVRDSDEDALKLNVTIPLYQSGAEWSRVRAARNLEQKAKFDAMDTRQVIVQDAARAWQDYQTAVAVIGSTQKAMEAAGIALEGTRNENEFGTRTILDVLDAEQEFFQSRVNVVKAQRAEKLFAYRLLLAMGRLTAHQLQISGDIYDPKQHYDTIKYQLIGF